MEREFRVGVSADLLSREGPLSAERIGLARLDDTPGLVWWSLPADASELTPEQVADYDALLLLAGGVSEATLAGVERLTLIARFGVGYDQIDVPACTRAGVLLTITPDGVRRPVAAAAMSLILALTHNLLHKDRLLRSGRWDRLAHLGMGLTGRTLGLVGVGNVGRELLGLAAPFGMRHLAHDPYVDPAAAGGAELVELDELLGVADVVCLTLPLNDETRRLIDARRLALMRPSSYLVNVARGPIVDQAALTDALRERRIAGAGLDVFEQEPVDPADPLLRLDNVIVAPHSLCWTDELMRGNGRSACEAIIDVAGGRVPRHVVNREALDSPTLRAKLLRHADGKEG